MVTGCGDAVFVIDRSAFAGPPMIVTTVVDELEQPPVVMVMPRVTEPEAAAVKVIDGVPTPAVIVPPLIDQE